MVDHERSANQRIADIRFNNVMEQVDRGKISFAAAMIALRETVVLGQQLEIEYGRGSEG